MSLSVLFAQCLFRLFVMQCRIFLRSIIHKSLTCRFDSPLSDRDAFAVTKQKLLVDLPYMIHIHKKALMAAIESFIIQFLFNGIQCFVNGIFFI